MRVTFLLPGSSPTPTGGTKNIYEHANRLAAKGHAVTIVHAAHSTRNGMRTRVRGTASFILNRIGIMQWRPDSWFTVDRRVILTWAPNLSPRFIPEGDAVIATAWQTAEWLQHYPSSKGKPFYFAMDFERFMEAPPDLQSRIRAIHAAGQGNLVISPAGSRMIEESGAPTPGYVPCALDFATYHLENGFEAESRPMIGLPVRPEPHKAVKDAIAALELVKRRRGFAEEIWGFGGARPDWLPEWIRFYHLPADRELSRLYNLTRVFVVPSQYEGWGLPGSEAMACGAALVSTDNGGVRAYADDGKTALITPVGNPAALADAIARLLDDDPLRIRLARAGAEHIREFTWDRSSEALEQCLIKGLKPQSLRGET